MCFAKMVYPEFGSNQLYKSTTLYQNKQHWNLPFTNPKCLKYKIKGKDHNIQTQLYFYSILIIYYSIMGYMFRLLSSHLQALMM